MTRVPERWIPFVSVDADGSDREIELQRVARLRPIERDSQPLAIVRPRTVLREGLDLASPADGAVFLWPNAPLRPRTARSAERSCIRPGGGDAAGGVT